MTIIVNLSIFYIILLGDIVAICISLFFKYYFSVILSLLNSLLSYFWSCVSHALQYHTVCTIQSDFISYWRSNQLFHWEELVTNNYQLVQKYFCLGFPWVLPTRQIHWCAHCQSVRAWSCSIFWSVLLEVRNYFQSSVSSPLKANIDWIPSKSPHWGLTYRFYDFFI